MDGEVSNWKSVLFLLRLCSVLLPILFLMYINDLEGDVTSKIMELSDDTNICERKMKIIGISNNCKTTLINWSRV